jgi:enterochelin esterase-like enzyme
VGDVEFSWEVHGGASTILDDLLKDGLIEPIVIIMPYGFASNEDKSARKFASKEWFDKYLERVIPEVESAYNVQVKKTPNGHYLKRAIAGLSMGGKQALEFGLNHLDLFSAIGSFSGAIQKRLDGYALPQLLAACKEKEKESLLRSLALFYVACGKDDPIGTDKDDTQSWLLEANRKLASELQASEIPALWHEMEGVHNWGVWKSCLREFLPIVTSKWRQAKEPKV